MGDFLVNSAEWWVVFCDVALSYRAPIGVGGRRERSVYGAADR
ncbi:hypothetical protein GZL_02728 [Streptomyces sp. 769]|nr:hypothetical protein GZL_02728 [Streptomyces sp. 769]